MFQRDIMAEKKKCLKCGKELKGTEGGSGGLEYYCPNCLDELLDMMPELDDKDSE